MRSPLATLVLLACPAAVVAQSIAGTVIEAGSDRPVAGAMVRLGDSNVRFLTGADGRYRLDVPAPGSYRLTVERIGFADGRFGPVDVGGDVAVRFDLEVQTAPIELDGLEVAAESRICALDRAEGGRLQSVWDEVRKALRAASWTEDRGLYRFRIRQTRRLLDRSGESVMDEATSEGVRVGANSIRTLSAEALARDGFVQELDGHLHYFGPDATVLLSDAFLANHCLAPVQGSGDQVGVAFAPTPGRDEPDIQGTVWVDRETLALARVEFTYTGIDHVLGHRLAGGEVHFARLPDGRWIVRDWTVRAPLSELVRSVGAGGRTVDRPMLIGVQQTGATVLSVDSAEEEAATLAPGHQAIAFEEGESRRPTVAVRGRVVDADTDAPIEAATVELVPQETSRPGRTVSVSTDAEGRFAVPVAIPGRYRLSVRHLAYANVDAHPLTLRPGVRPLEIQLFREAVEVPGIVVEVQARSSRLRSVGFHARERSGQGVYLDRGDLDEMAPRTLTDVFSRMPQMTVASSGNEALLRPVYQFRRAGMTAGICPPALFLDGRPVGSGGDVDSLIAVDAVEAVEFYPSAARTPIEFSGAGAGCGVILVWSR